MTKSTAPAIVISDMDASESAFGPIRFGERRWSTDPAVIGLPEVWLPDGATVSELRTHAAGRAERAFAASMAARKAREADEAEHGPIHLTSAEGGSNA